MVNNNSLEKSILAAVVYYDEFGYPLTLWELRKNLINPEREKKSNLPAGKGHSNILQNVRMSGRGSRPVFEVGLFEILDLLDSSDLLKKTLGERDGFHFLKGRENIVAQRIERQKISEERWKKARRRAFLFRLVPFLKLAFVSGSLALNNAKQNSDVDLLLVSKAGRIWTCRSFALLVLAAFGVLRRGNKIAGRFCLNHFITDASLEIKNQSLYNARTYGNLVPFIVRDKKVLAEFWKKNGWLENYILNFNQPSLESVNFHTAYVKDAGSGTLNRFGNLAEKFFAFLQKRRIEKDPRTKKTGGRVVVDNSRLEFHPDSPEAEILAKYNEKMAALGFPELADEKDSGLLE